MLPEYIRNSLNEDELKFQMEEEEKELNELVRKRDVINSINKFDCGVTPKQLEAIADVILSTKKFNNALTLEWIPIKEQVPEEYGPYLATIHDTGSKYFVAICSYTPGYEFWNYFHDSIVAWAKVPEPWGGAYE